MEIGGDLILLTSRERLLKVIKGEIPDHVPVTPDISNMIPAKLTKKPFWEIYLYKNPPQWKAYIDAVKYFGFDSLMDGYVPVNFEDLGEITHTWEELIVSRCDDRIITQKYKIEDDKKIWSDTVSVYYRADPPTHGLAPEEVGLSLEPDSYEPVKGVQEWPQGEKLLNLAQEEMGEHGLVGVNCGTTKLVNTEEQIYDYYDNPEKYHQKREKLLDYYQKRFDKLMSLDVKPDFICTGASGTLIHQTVEMFRELALPMVKRITKLAKEEEIPTHVHSCGPQKDLVRILAEETELTVIDPLEPPPMGDCNLKELKEKYGDKLVLKGNLHTTKIMLHGTRKEVVDASRKAIDAAAENGGFILSTGDQCGRDTPEENIFAMIETAKIYGKY